MCDLLLCNTILCLDFQTRLYAAQAARKLEAAEHVSFQPQEVQVSEWSVLFLKDGSIWPTEPTCP